MHITDTYHFVGSLLVRKTIAGPGAGQQGEIRIHTVCDGKALTPDFAIPAGTPAGDQTKQYDQIDAPAKCTVTETADGHTSTAPVVVDGSGQTASVAAGDIVEVHISDSYAAAFGAASGIQPASSGSLLISKTTAGPLARRQGPVTIRVACNGTALSPDFVIPARTRAGRVSRSYDGIPAGSVCTVTETADGTTKDVRVQVIGNRRTVTVPGGKVVPVNLVNVYRATPGTLKVTKTIAGSAARPARSHRHPGGLWRSAQDLRVPHRGPHRRRFRVAPIPRPPGTIPLRRHRDRRRPHSRGGRGRPEPQDGDHTRQPQRHRSSH